MLKFPSFATIWAGVTALFFWLGIKGQKPCATRTSNGARPPDRLILKVTLNQTVEDAVNSLGFELVELERSAGGLLRVTIDFPWVPGDAAEPRAIGVDDCEAVSRQLQYALEVDGTDYQRLEVSSPGVDRPLRSAHDFARFEGHDVAIVLRDPIGPEDGALGVAQIGRKRFNGRLQKAAASSDEWQLIWHDQAPRRGQKKAAAEQVLTFALTDLQSARLDPQLDFRGRRRSKGKGGQKGR